MAFAAAFARPGSSSRRVIRPGPASLWFPPRPFPVSLWLAERPTAPHFASIPTGATRSAAPAGAARAALPRLDLELRLLFSRCPCAPDDDFFMALRIELGQRAWSLDHAIGAPRPNWAPAPGTESDLEKRRARLVTEVNLGLTMVETAPIRYPRLIRNVLLVRHAGHIGRCLRDLLAHPEAGSLAEELQRLLDGLQRLR